MNNKVTQIVILCVLTLIAFTAHIHAQSTSAKEEYQQGEKLFNTGQAKEAFKLLKSSANKGYAPAMNAIGYCYQHGKGISKNYTYALQWYRNAAVHEEASGAYNYGWMHLKGVGVKKNNDVAKKWLTIAANAGYADAKKVLEQEGWLNEETKPPERPIQSNEKHVQEIHKPKTITPDKTGQTSNISSQLNRYSRNKSKWYAGSWDSKIYNLLDHPKTVALRVEVLDSETLLPLEDVQVLFKGTYMTEERTSRHPDGEQRAQEQEFERATRTGKDGIVIVALGWQKEYPWRYGTDEIEKVQLLEVLRRGYHFVKQETPFKRLLYIGQNKGSDSQEPRFFKMFEETWAKECSRSNVKFCTLRFSKNFSDLDNKNSIQPEFFEIIRKKDWGIIYKRPVNRMQWEDKNQRLCGPYLIYTIRITMDRLIKDNDQNRRNPGYSSKTPIIDNREKPTNLVRTDNSKAIARSHWQIGFLEGIDWGMGGEDVGNILSKKGLRLKVVSNHTNEGVNHHDAEVLGQPLYGKIRVDGIRMSFANKKLTSVSFGPADKSGSAAEKLYAHIRDLFGTGMTTSWSPDHKVKESIESPDLCHKSERYFSSTAIESRIDYTWMQERRRYGRWCLVQICDWETSDKVYNTYHSIRARDFQKLMQGKADKKEISCENCNGSGNCLNCKGKGHSYEDSYIRCTYPACGGNGRYKVMNGGIRTCDRCRGTGRLKAYGGPKKVACSKCAGGGKCSICNGKGKVNSP